MRGFFFGSIIVIAGCGGEDIAPKAITNPSSMERASDSGNDGKIANSIHFAFTITKVYENQDISKTSPFHTVGGNWTFFDCDTIKTPSVSFIVGVTSKSKKKGKFAWGNAILAVADRTAGGKLVKQYARRIHAKLPESRPTEMPLQPLFVNTAIYGEDLKESAEGGIDHGNGWTDTKWTVENNGHSAEVFFNYNLQARQGEFCEENSEYRQELIAAFSTALRDGPRPERTAETDRSLTTLGPRVEQVCCLSTKFAGHFAFSPDSRHFVYRNGSKIFAIDPSQPDKRIELASFEKSIDRMYLIGNKLQLFVCETLSVSDSAWSSEDPERYWWVDPMGERKHLLAGPEQHLGWCDPPVSPDCRYVAIERWKDRAGGHGRYSIIDFLDRTLGRTNTAQLPNECLTMAGWQGSGAELKAVLVTNRIDGKKPEKVYLADPASGQLSAGTDDLAPDSARRPIAPDGKHRVDIIGEERLELIDLVTNQKRVYDFREDERPYVDKGCVKWAGSGFLSFYPGHLALIDIGTMKMCYPTGRPPRGVFESFIFSPDFQWAACELSGEGKEGLYLYRVSPSKVKQQP